MIKAGRKVCKRPKVRKSVVGHETVQEVIEKIASQLSCKVGLWESLVKGCDKETKIVETEQVEHRCIGHGGAGCA